MKKRPLLVLWLSFLAALMVFVYACHKDSISQHGSAVNPADLTVAQAKSYLDSALNSSSANIKLQSTDASRQYNLNGFAYWQMARAFQAQHFNVVEIPLIIDKKKVNLYDFSRDGIKISPDDAVARASFSRLIIYRDTVSKAIDKEIVTYLPDKAWLTAHRNDASGNWIDKLAPDFSGYIEYKKWDGTPAYTIRIYNGKRTARYSLTTGQAMPQTGQGKQLVQSESVVKPANLVCDFISVPDYVTVCTQDAEGNLSNCDTHFNGTYTNYYYCYDDGTGGYIDPQPPTNPPPPGGGPGAPVSPWPSDLILNTPPPGQIITNIATYIKCFVKTSSAVVNIYVSQPTANSSATWSGPVYDPNVGHTFVSIQQGGITRVFGFYPAHGVNPFTSPTSPSALVDDSGHPYDVSISFPVTPAQLTNLLNYASTYPATYNLNTLNCTDFGIQAAAQAGVTLPDHNGSWPGGGGSNPGNLGQDMRGMTPPAGATITKTSGTAVSNTGTCP